jgi:hypothetical protein
MVITTWCKVLIPFAQIANEDAVPYIIAEIPTNLRVEVPNLIDLKNVLRTQNGCRQ